MCGVISRLSLLFCLLGLWCWVLIWWLLVIMFGCWVGGCVVLLIGIRISFMCLLCLLCSSCVMLCF